MKYKWLTCAALAVAAASCDNDDLHIGMPENPDLVGPDGNIVYVTDALGKSAETSFSFNGSGTLKLYANTTKAIAGNCDVQFAYNAEALNEYNQANNTSYPALPASMVQMSNGGKVDIAAGALKSNALDLTISGNGQLDPATTYALPLSFEVTGGAASKEGSNMIILVRDYSTFPGTDKTYNGAPGMKMMAVLEVNDVNPLNVMGFTMQGSGKQFFDICVLFAANININSTTGLPYVSCNDNVQAILSNRDKYIAPLQERGIKVVLGLLGNHDAAGVSTMTRSTTDAFAQEVKTVCDVYGLDGIFLDDEYTDYNGAASGRFPGFQKRSIEAASYMMYAIKKAQPEKLMISYRYEDLFSAVDINGEQPGQFVDYVVNDYGVVSDPTSTYPGLEQSQAGTGSWNCSDWAQWIPANKNYSNKFSLEGMREDGYGTLMIYNFTCNPDFWMTSYILNDLGKAAQAFFAADIEYDGSWYPKDWN